MKALLVTVGVLLAGFLSAEGALNTKGLRLRTNASATAIQPTSRNSDLSVVSTVKVTLTTYWAQGRGSDRWTRQYRSSSGKRLQPGVSVAADPRIFPYGSIIEIPGLGRRIVKDTGTHVVQRLASRKRGVNYPVIDIFFDTRAEALQFARNHPPFAEVRIVQFGG